MEQLPHLKFIQKLNGKPRFHGGGGKHDKSKENSGNRAGHGKKLSNTTVSIKSTWETNYSERDDKNLAPLNEDIVPIFLKISPKELDMVDFDLHSFGIEIISEQENGYIIGASLDGLRSLEEKINGFIAQEYGTGKIADLWEIIDGKTEEWKPQRILSKELLEKWNEISDDVTYTLEVSIAFDRPLQEKPDRTKQGGETRLKKYKESLIEWDERLMKREAHFEEFINYYGEIISSLVHLEDSFACEVKITGKGLKDLVHNYQFVFDISEKEDIRGVESILGNSVENSLEILPPDEDAPKVGLIDSGVMEAHKYISPAISHNSKSYLKNDSSVVDKVKGGGHGTRVAGAILYPNGISAVESPYQLPCFIRNLRVLDQDNKLTDGFPADLMQKIVMENEDCKIFNLSINSTAPFRKKHMSSWAATIDSLTHSRNVLFIISVGNITKDDIRRYTSKGKVYPAYLYEPYCRLANPAQSSFGLAVGSINHYFYEDDYWKSIGEKYQVSAFSRIGEGIWGKIKPDVVEFGGGLIMSKNSTHSVRENEHTALELLRSTLHGGTAVGKDSTGTSFSTPRVSHIAAQLLKLYPNEGINLIRALIIQGARLPNYFFQNPTKESIQCFGYGLPSIERVTNNTEQRVTFYNTGNLKAEDAHIYSLGIPQNLRSQASEYDVLVEVTLAYTAKVRRTRQRTKSYFSTWLDWTASKLDEPYADFKDYVLKEIEGTETNYDKDARGELNGFNWKIRERTDWGTVKDINRNNSTAQKDWTIIKSFQLPEEISFAVRAHKGWDKNKEEVPYALTVSIEFLGSNIPVYELIKIENEIKIEV